jgi:predicted phage gp36 major capsid-like protein
MLDDAAFDVERWLAQEIATEFARAEGAAFVAGSGVNRPKGFLAAPNSAQGDGVRPFGTLQFLTSGAAGGFAASTPAGQADRPRPGAASALPAGRGVRDEFGDGGADPQVQDRGRRVPVAAGAGGGAARHPARLSVVEAEDMPDVAADSLSIAFGNFKAGYLIAERTETQILRDPVHPQAVRAFLRDQADRRAGDEFGSDQADEVLA